MEIHAGAAERAANPLKGTQGLRQIGEVGWNVKDHLVEGDHAAGEQVADQRAQGIDGVTKVHQDEPANGGVEELACGKST